MASPCLCKPPMTSEPTSQVKPVTKQTFGRASPEAAREAAGEALPNGPNCSTANLFSVACISNSFISLSGWSGCGKMEEVAGFSKKNKWPGVYDLSFSFHFCYWRRSGGSNKIVFGPSAFKQMFLVLLLQLRQGPDPKKKLKKSFYLYRKVSLTFISNTS